MIISKMTGVIEENGVLSYVEVSTKQEPTGEHYAEVVYLEASPKVYKKFPGSMVSQNGAYYLPGGEIKIQEVQGPFNRYVGKEELTVTDVDGSIIVGTALIESTDRVVILRVSGRTLVGGLLQKMESFDARVHENERRTGDIEETGKFVFFLSGFKIIASYQKEWCGCTANELRTFVNSISLEKLDSVTGGTDEELAEALSDNSQE